MLIDIILTKIHKYINKNTLYYFLYSLPELLVNISRAQTNIS